MSIPISVSLQDLSYAQGSGSLAIDASALLDGPGNFRGGLLNFALSGDGDAGEALGLASVGSADIAAGAVSVVGTDVFLGDGSMAELIGSIDQVLNGQSGVALRVNFISSSFENGNFNQGADGDVIITGWTADTSRIHLDGVDSIAGWATPVDTTYPGDNTNGDNSTLDILSTPASAALSSLSGTGPGDLSIRLETDQLAIQQSYGVIRGPFVASNAAIALAAGETVSFAWKALGTGDAYDAYGYLLNVDTGATITLLDQTGSAAGVETDWATETLTLTSGQDGNYRFVFVAGSFDASGGNFLGGTLMIDDVTAMVANPPSPLGADAVAALARLVTYQNADAGASDGTTTLTTTVVDESGDAASDTSTIWLSQTYTGPVAGIANQWNGTAGNDQALGTSGNDFIALGAGDDVAAGGDGDDVIDGGTGSNFLSGGEGWDRFFVDARGTPPTWSTITDFAPGEQVAVWGWRPGVSTMIRAENEGAAGWQGATLHVDVDGDGGIDASVTWAGLAWSDLPAPSETSVGGTGLLWFA